MILSQYRRPHRALLHDVIYLPIRPPSLFNTGSDSACHKGAYNLMDNTQDELKAHLMRTDEEFRRLVEKHTQYDHLLDEIESKPHVTPEDEIEEHRIKKLKLQLKDQMNEILGRHRTQSVA